MKHVLLFLALFAPVVALADISDLAQPITSAEHAEQVAQECKGLQRKIELSTCAGMATFLFLVSKTSDFTEEQLKQLELMRKNCAKLAVEEAQEFNKAFENKLPDIASAQETEEQEVAVHSDLAQATK